MSNYIVTIIIEKKTNNNNNNKIIKIYGTINNKIKKKNIKKLMIKQLYNKNIIYTKYNINNPEIIKIIINGCSQKKKK